MMSEQGDAFTTTASHLCPGSTLAFSACAPIESIGGVAGDMNDGSDVDAADMLMLLGDWGVCPDGGKRDADLDGDCEVNASDLTRPPRELELIARCLLDDGYRKG